MRNRKIILAIPALVSVVLFGVCIKFTAIGFEHVDPASQWRLANAEWANGNIGEALVKSAEAIGMGLECGVRWTIAGHYINKMRVLESNNHLNEALAQCVTAVQILNGYDDEGVVSYDCEALEEAIKRQSP